MKILLLVLIFIFFLFLAVFIYYKYLIRYKLHKDCEFVCKNLKNNITFNKNNLEKLLELVSENITNITKDILTKKRVSQLFINKNDVNLINQFLNSLGKGDVEYEVNNINYYENVFSDLKKLSYSQLKTNGAMYLKLIIGVGLAMVIILI